MAVRSKILMIYSLYDLRALWNDSSSFTGSQELFSIAVDTIDSIEIVVAGGKNTRVNLKLVAIVQMLYTVYMIHATVLQIPTHVGSTTAIAFVVLHIIPPFLYLILYKYAVYRLLYFWIVENTIRTVSIVAMNLNSLYGLQCSI